MAIPWSALKEMAPRTKPPKANDQWRINFSRVDWDVQTQDGTYEKATDENGKVLPEHNWVWSAQGAIAMHMPEWWGYVQFDDTAAGESASKFKHKKDEQIKWALWQLYYLQKKYNEEKGHYQSDLKYFELPHIDTCIFKPELYTTKFGFQFTALSCKGNKTWVIDETGKIESHKN